MRFIPIDLHTWPRGQMFYYFSQMAPTSYSLTVEIDVTELLEKLKDNNRKFFPTYLWLVTTCLNRQQEFKVACRENQLGYYETLTPLYASFHEDDKTFSPMWTEYDQDYLVFYDRYCDNQRKFAGNHGVLCQPQTPPPEDAYTISTVPWISFSHFSLQTQNNKPYFFPTVEAGRVASDANGRKRMPLSITCHHAATDGYHVDQFLKDFRSETDKLCSELHRE